jgi:hypothetical protein
MHRPREAGSWSRFGVIVGAKTVVMAHNRFKGNMSRPNRTGPRFVSQDVTVLKRQFVFRLLAIAHSAFFFVPNSLQLRYLERENTGRSNQQALPQ